MSSNRAELAVLALSLCLRPTAATSRAGDGRALDWHPPRSVAPTKQQMRARL